MTQSIIPSTPEDRKKIAGVVKAISDAMTRSEAEKEYIKEAKDALKKEFMLSSKDINKMVIDFHKHKFNERVQEIESYSELYEAIFGPQDDE